MREQRRLEIPVQGKLGQDANRFSPGCFHCPQGSPSPRPNQAAQLPGKENAGTDALPAPQRTGHGQEYAGSRGRGPARPGSVEMQITLPGSVNDGSVEFTSNPVPISSSYARSFRICTTHNPSHKMRPIRGGQL